MIRKGNVIQISAAESPWNESDPSSLESPTNFISSVYSRLSELCDAKENLLPISHSLAQSFSVGTYTMEWRTSPESAPLTSFCQQCLHSLPLWAQKILIRSVASLLSLFYVGGEVYDAVFNGSLQIAGSKLRLTYYKSLPCSTISCI
jgi:hypothetical protein